MLLHYYSNCHQFPESPLREEMKLGKLREIGEIGVIGVMLLSSSSSPFTFAEQP